MLGVGGHVNDTSHTCKTCWGGGAGGGKPAARELQFQAQIVLNSCLHLYFYLKRGQKKDLRNLAPPPHPGRGAKRKYFWGAPADVYILKNATVNRCKGTGSAWANRPSSCEGIGIRLSGSGGFWPPLQEILADTRQASCVSVHHDFNYTPSAAGSRLGTRPAFVFVTACLTSLARPPLPRK